MENETKKVELITEDDLSQCLVKIIKAQPSFFKSRQNVDDPKVDLMKSVPEWANAVLMPTKNGRTLFDFCSSPEFYDQRKYGTDSVGDCNGFYLSLKALPVTYLQIQKKNEE